MLGEYPPLGPRLLYWCADCAARWRGYGAPTGCDRHSGAQAVVQLQLTDVSPETMALLFGDDWEEHVNWMGPGGNCPRLPHPL